MNRKHWAVAGMLALTLSVAGIAMAQETAVAKSGESLDAAGLPASIAQAIKYDHHHHHYHGTRPGGIRR